MEEIQERSLDRLARYLIILGTLALLGALCYFFSNVIVYVALAFVVSLIGIPLAALIKKIRIKGKSMPDALAAILSLIIVFLGIGVIVGETFPVITGIVNEAAAVDESAGYTAANPLRNVNDWLIDTFPVLGNDFRLEVVLLDQIKDAVNLSDLSGMMKSLIGSVASLVSTVAVALFSIIFISFFFIRDRELFSKIVCALVPDRYEERVRKALGEIEHLLSRYFVGMIIEVVGVALINFILLWSVGRIGFQAAIGIAFLAGIFNIIPYVGPLMGEGIGVILAVILKLGTGVGLNVNIWVFALIILLLMLTTQLIDNFVFQPIIYSTSIKASPLEIFIVLLAAGHIGGIVGMLAAIPAYTVLRVIASRFFYHLKPIRRLIPDRDGEA
jgi:predicted PurR-regulated permease PerM